MDVASGGWNAVEHLPMFLIRDRDTGTDMSELQEQHNMYVPFFFYINKSSLQNKPLNYHHQQT